MKTKFNFAADHLIACATSLSEEFLGLMLEMESFDNWEHDFEWLDENEEQEHDGSVWSYIESHKKEISKIKCSMFSKGYGSFLTTNPAIEKWFDLIESLIDYIVQNKTTDQETLSLIYDQTVALKEFAEILYTKKSK